MVNSVPTLVDVAHLAGVSKSTASRILAALPVSRVPYAPQTRQKVLEAANKLGYKPSKLARGLTLAKTGIVGLVVPSLTDSFFPGVTAAIETRLAERGYSVILAPTQADSRVEGARIEDLLGWRVEGLIVAPAQETADAGAFWQLWQHKTPFVLLDRSFPDTPFASVTTDDESGATLAVEHLLAIGRRRIAWAGGHLSISTNRLRHAGYSATLIRHGIFPDPAYAFVVPPAESGGHGTLESLLAIGPRPDAVFCFSDRIAMGVLEACRLHGVRVPQDLAVVGYADLPHSSQLKTSLTTVRQPQQTIGQRAADLLLACMDGQSPQQPVVVPVELVIRESTAGLIY
jgi:DNA-binding LacI/PurR family transcriptional regulator